jgi:replicative DNA helicase
MRQNMIDPIGNPEKHIPETTKAAPTTSERFPFQDNIEEVLLKSFLQERKFWLNFKDDILPEYFNKQAHGNIFKIFRAFFNKYNDFPNEMQCVDIATKKGYGDETNKKIKTIYHIDTLKPKEIQYLHDESEAFIHNNKIKTAILESVDLLEKREYLEIEEIIKTAISWHHKIELGLELSDIDRRIALIQEDNNKIVKSPWDTLNQVLNGGFRAKQLHLVVSSSSVGKSIFLDNCATHSWRAGLNVVEITLELSEVVKAQRMDAEIHKVPTADWHLHVDEMTKYYKNTKFNSHLFLKEFPTDSINANNIKQYLQQLKLYTGVDIDLLIVDYLDIMNPTKFGNNEYENQGNIGANLRAIAQEFDFPVLSASQLSRGAKQLSMEELDETKISDSWKKMMISDTMIALANSTEERIAGFINFKMLKNRAGQKDVIWPMRVSYENLKIYSPTKK